MLYILVYCVVGIAMSVIGFFWLRESGDDLWENVKNAFFMFMIWPLFVFLGIAVFVFDRIDRIGERIAEKIKYG